MFDDAPKTRVNLIQIDVNQSEIYMYVCMCPLSPDTHLDAHLFRVCLICFEHHNRKYLCYDFSHFIF